MKKIKKYTRQIFSLLFFTVMCLNAKAIKFVHGPYLQNVYATEATVVWESDAPSVGWVELAPNDGTNYYSFHRKQYFDTKIGVKNTATLHAVRITGLKVGTTYRYRVYAKEVLSHQGFRVKYGDVVATDVFKKGALTFTTLNPAKSETSFVILNDVHAKENVITTLLNFAKFKERDLIFFNGDMVSIENCADDFFNGFMNESMNLFAQEQCPYYVRGNHETRGEFATHFQDYFNPCQPHLYFIIRQGPICFICLDTGEDKPDDDIEYSGITDYDNYRSEEAEWLKTVKDTPEFKTAKFKVVIAHMPTTKEKDDWHGPRDCTKKFTPILNEMGIDIMLCGHLHVDKYYEANKTVCYPVLVNSNIGSIEGETNGDELKITVRHLDGSVFSTRVFKAHHRY